MQPGAIATLKTTVMERFQRFDATQTLSAWTGRKVQIRCVLDSQNG